MRFISYSSPEGPRLAGLGPLGYVDLAASDAQLPASLRGLLADWPALQSQVEQAVQHGQPLDETALELLPPVLDPRKILCVGLNYASHAAETGASVGEEPVIFSKLATTLIAHGNAIRLPAVSREVDFEAELVAVIGRGGKNIARESALEHVAGYCCGNDVSARDWQKGKPGKQWLLGKSFDSFAPLGPEFVTADEVGDPHKLSVRLRLNGQVMQEGHTSDLIFPIDFVVSYLSQVCTLEPGDLIFTGTPAGVGMARKPPVFLQAGDEVEVEIEHLGTLRNRVE